MRVFRDHGMTDTEPDGIGQLVRVLNLQARENDVFHADVEQEEGRLFGGLVLAQSVVAAGRTVSQGNIHSLHAYFLRAGKPAEGIDYHVERVRDGRNFTTRRISAIQAGDMIFEASISFTLPENGIEHQKPMPPAPDPAGQPSWWETVATSFPPGMVRRGPGRRGWPQPLDIRAVAGGPKSLDGTGLPHRTVWAKPLADLPEDPIIHAATMAYMSDSGLIATVASPYGMWAPGGSSASLDHAMWWHQPPRFDDWLLYTSDSPVAHSARALILAHMYRRDGALVATVAQEGLFRMPKARQE